MTGENTTSVDPFTQGRHDFVAWSPLLWDPTGAAAVTAIPVRPGDRVLDVCCGAGGSALPAARAAGATGHVDAVDLSPGLVGLGRERAKEQGLQNIHFATADALTWTESGYDALLCCYGVFFFPGMDTGTRSLLNMLRPGSRFGIVTWATAAMAEFAPLMIQAIRTHHPRMTAPTGRDQAERISTPTRLTRWLTGLGTHDVQVQYLCSEPALPPELAWSLVMGTGFRALLPPDPLVRRRIQATLTELLDRQSVTTIRLDSLVATGTVPG